jgi:hypothetical protein
MNTLRAIPLPLRLGAAGIATGVATAFAITLIFGGARTLWWWPAGALTLAFVGFMGAWMIGEELVGGRIDARDEAEALRRRHDAGWPDSAWDEPC